MTAIAKYFTAEAIDLLRQEIDYLTAADADDTQYTFILLGVTGDLAKKKLMPTLWTLFRENLLPRGIKILGAARKDSSVPEVRKLVDPYVLLKDQAERDRYEEFWKINVYQKADTSKAEDLKALEAALETIEKGKKVGNRLFYFSLPPSVYADTAKALHDTTMSKTGWSRFIIEKPFGSDSETADDLSNKLKALFTEDQIYRIDHYLGKEMVQNLLTLRFGNRLFEPEWSNKNIANVEILFKEPFGIQGRGSFFEQTGIIRDVMQNHLLQVLVLTAIDKPLANDADKIRDEKVKLLKSMSIIEMKDVVLGQYVANPNGQGEALRGYRQEPDVAKDSTVPTFALLTIHIDNDRWRGVPFFIRAGKALNESRVEVRVQFKDLDNDIFSGQTKRNMTIFRVQPNEAIYQRINIKRPGMGFSLEETELDLTYGTRFHNAVLPDAYERLLIDAFNGDQLNFVRTDELTEAWRVFTPILHQIDKDKKAPEEYIFGSQGPKAADDLQAKYGLIRENN